MNTSKPIHRAPRAALAVLGAHRARRRLARREVIARQLDAIAPGTVHVRTVPVQTDRDGEQRAATWVVLDDVLGLPVKADRTGHRAARGLLVRMFPGADWSRALAYDARTGDLRLDEPAAPAALGFEGAPEPLR
ncbi:hypothetical protein [Streptomyces prunicolor]|uniref:hypothetical protein n=1 Tax=Streptomyces prunicolor TaxID=67348 RepID=UPI00039DE579|nr:hypothetical protein [Streptomyces prunicolor]